MYKIALHRLGHSALLIFGVVTVIFFTNFMIGDPVRVMLPASTPPEAVEDWGWGRVTHRRSAFLWA